MTVQYRTKTFKSGDGVAVPLPMDIDLPEGTDVIVERNLQGGIEIKRVPDPVEERHRWLALLDDLQAMGPPPGGTQKRLPVDIPLRKGL